MGFFGSEGVIYKPVDEVDVGPNSDEVYISPNVKAPRMAGFLVKLFVWILESRIFGMIFLYVLKKDNLIHKLVSYAELEDSPVYVPLHPSEDPLEQEVRCINSKRNPCERAQEALECLPSSSESISSETNPWFRRWTILDYSKAYRSRVLTPSMVAERFIRAVEQSSSAKCNMSFFISCDAKNILEQAAESTLRHERGEPLSVLDGVPIAIKDEMDCIPYPTTGGTKWLHNFRSSKNDACCVERLRSCGALLVGKTNMHELGAGTSGINPHYGVSRNPYDTRRISGGSSSGSAAVVCAGLCPVALGVDGGGSVRMPASLCGVVGLKPTFGRVPHTGVLPLNWTVGMVGILAGTVEDALITYSAISGQLLSDQPTVLTPNVNLPLLRSQTSVGDIKIAKYGKWFDDCQADIKLCCSHALDKLRKCYGWETIEVTIPEIETMRLAHYITIGSECTAALDNLRQKLNSAVLGWDARVGLSVYGSFSGMEYIKAQKIRGRQMYIHNKVFSQANVIVTPTTGVTAYMIKDDASKTGELDYINGAALVRYQIAGNFLGLPAVTVPIGYDEAGLPIGLQFIGRPWTEATLMHIAFAVQALCISDCRKPAVFYDLFNST
ncbi:fatty acid amide hydrolase isoform X1 [Beta vulgaris subsp. vulgaris]|uniref:fatty acid amide hydrolase isoform X1 n=2 Tax=Beta vulgaris subsp. vulgaris TaxID=3555 RepID=UPI0020371BCB|nr:fatty acid amide hydrolase isoform X1 [Beta vulgaris subsp. vulgaris]